MKEKTIKIVILFSFAVLFVSFLNNYLVFRLWDYDFWWHLSTGRYMVENKVIPDTDPFSFVYNLAENKPGINPLGEGFNLKQYWLAQILFYKIYTVFGDKGIILLRSLILLIAVSIVSIWLLKEKVAFYIIFPIAYFLHVNTLSFVGERPVLFSILFTIITFIILDRYKRRGGRIIYGLIPLMLIWANLHGGFILGDVMIMVYMAGGYIDFIFKRDGFDRKRFMPLLILGLVAIGVSGINPNGFQAFLTATPQYNSVVSNTYEYYSPFALSSSKVNTLNWGYIAFLVVFPVSVLLRHKKIDLVYYVLLCGLLFMSVKYMRFEIFYACIASMIIGRELQCAVNDYLQKHGSIRSAMERAAALLIVASAVLYAGGVINPGSIKFGKATFYSVPEGAADFVRQNNIKGNMFNDMGSGGYLIWRFYPWKKIFADTRSLNSVVTQEYSWVMTSVVSLKNRELPEGKKPLWKRLLDHYDIDVIVINTMDAFGHVPPLIFSLLKSEEWAPVYHDVISIVFVRDKPDNKLMIDKKRLTEDAVYDALIVRYTQMVSGNAINPYYMLSLGEIFYNMKRYSEALKAYEFADQRLPGNDIIKARIVDSKARLEEEKRNKDMEQEKHGEES